MICQSDYDSEGQARFRQSDECVEDWWEPKRQQAAPHEQGAPGPGISQRIVRREARRRGLLREEDERDEFFL
jgi:hypothetical protein